MQKVKEKFKRPAVEFCNLLQVDHFVEIFLKFLQEKHCCETLEFILSVQLLEKNPLLKDVLLPQIIQIFIKQGSQSELNLNNKDRGVLLDKYYCWKHSSTELRTKELINNLVHIKTMQLLQLQQERYQEFRQSIYWDIFMSRLQEDSVAQELLIDLSFRWLKPVQNWTPKQVSLWLQSMEVEEYALFEEHQVDGEMLASISREDLISMSITKIGSLKKVLRLLQAISKQ